MRVSKPGRPTMRNPARAAKAPEGWRSPRRWRVLVRPAARQRLGVRRPSSAFRRRDQQSPKIRDGQRYQSQNLRPAQIFGCIPGSGFLRPPGLQP